MQITVYHNPRCGTSRNVLAAIREAGHEPEVIEYLKTPPSRDTLESLIARAGEGGSWFAARQGTLGQRSRAR